MASSSPLMETAPRAPGLLSHEVGDAIEPPRVQHLANGIKLKNEPIEDIKVEVQGFLQNSSIEKRNPQNSTADPVVSMQTCDPVIKSERPEILDASIKLEDDDIDMERHCGDVNMSEANGLSALQCYSSSDSEPDSQRPTSEARKVRSAIRSSSSSSSSSSDSSDEDEEIGRIHIDDECSSHSEAESAISNRPPNANGVPNKITGAVKKSKARMNADPYANDIKDLPPLPDITQLHIEEPLEFLHIGQVVNILDVLVSVESKPGIPAYDLGTVLFSDDEGAPLGFVDDVIGPVRCPIYIVRFVSKEQIHGRGIVVGQKIYAAPKSSLTKYVFLQQLLKLKGSDASWVDDLEVPTEFQDFSDDEQEQHSKPTNNKRAHNGSGVGLGGHMGEGSVGSSGGSGGSLKRHSSSSSSASTGSLERYRKFEQSMNMENDVNTRIHRIRDAIVTARRHRGGGVGSRPGARGHSRLITQASAGPACFSSPSVTMAVGTGGLLPKEVAAAAAFNPAVPPPPLGALVPLPPRAFAPGATPFAAAAAGHFAPGGLAWPSQPPLVMCGPPLGTGAPPPAPSPMPAPPTYGLFHNTTTTFRPMAPMNPVRPPSVCSTFTGGGGGGTTGPFALPPPRMGVPPYVRQARMPTAFPAAPAMGVLGSTNMGTGGPHTAAAPAPRYYTDSADVATQHLRFVYQSDMWLSNQSPPHQWPYSMPYLGMNLQQPPPSMQQLPPPRLLLPGPQPPRHRPHQGPVASVAADIISHTEQARLPTQN